MGTCEGSAGGVIGQAKSALTAPGLYAPQGVEMALE